ncbi:FxsB family cyclophane-forming radical SAM/SPASM peptide maturase [Cryptosporangium arvum]|uniref:Arylsulfatase regulator (Fe-S oxidoreductase) n=1 Tax=Cryptosporangium arvum DSM 44712 TaxID=927661 RepID=A0A010ZLF7_9ACTN|nr:FxsB family cyclophane-forming radical SAM/SPASM peptide maturase [Cryptosporangium arvum]EXG79504.1 arylsulfatase regulator (Fe-S oxidoreductase) [Cryptosporangium arvum DSM 44712]
MAEAAGTLSQFILKVHSRCNLACDYCYVYNGPDQSWQYRPAVMPRQTMEIFGRRLREYLVDRPDVRPHVVLHGGEPLLIGTDRLDFLATSLTEALAPLGRRARMTVQTNGLLLDSTVLSLLLRHEISVGLSMDGGSEAHGRHRRTRAGTSSFDGSTRAAELLRSTPFRSLYGGILAVIDVRNDPVEVYESLLELEPPTIDFLLPHATWDAPPKEGSTAYAEFLIPIFDRWFDEPRLKVEIRLFASLLELALGGVGYSELFGPARPPAIVVETDGTIERTDSFKIAYEGACSTGLDIFSNSFEQAAEHRFFASSDGGVPPCDTCLACPVYRLCGGGMAAHRYRSGSGFANPSVYCDGLAKLAEHVQGRAERALASLPLGRDAPGSHRGSRD